MFDKFAIDRHQGRFHKTNARSLHYYWWKNLRRRHRFEKESDRGLTRCVLCDASQQEWDVSVFNQLPQRISIGQCVTGMWFVVDSSPRRIVCVLIRGCVIVAGCGDGGLTVYETRENII